VHQRNLKMGFGLVADVVRHLKELDFVNVSSDYGILANSVVGSSSCKAFDRQMSFDICYWL
jgi:hypothetical protein